MKRISSKLALLIIAIIFISSSLSMVISTIFGYNFKGEIQSNQEAMKNSVVSLYKDHNLSMEEIIQVLKNNVFFITLEDNLSSYDLSVEEIASINQGQSHYHSGKHSHLPYTLFKIDDQYIKIGFDHNTTLFHTLASRFGLTFFAYLVVGTLLTVLAVKKMVKPLTKLTEATKEVAKGNFEIQVKNKGKDEIRLLTDHFNQMTRELKSIEMLRKDFITNFSHEFKTPLASIQGFAKLMAQSNLSIEDQQEYAHIIVEETERLSHLSSNILKLSKLENQEIVTRYSEFSLDEELRHCLLVLENKWTDKNLNLELDLEPVFIKGDASLLSQVWMNLFDNAIKFSNKNQTLKVQIIDQSDYVEIHIKDEGIGMSEEVIKRIYEKFYQGDPNHSAIGNGLGLALVKRIVELHQGSIGVESQMGRGSSFIIRLPKA